MHLPAIGSTFSGLPVPPDSVKQLPISKAFADSVEMDDGSVLHFDRNYVKKSFNFLKDTVHIQFSNKTENAFSFPFKGNVISPFGYRGRHKHTGVDIKLRKGDAVVSAFNGRVIMAKRYFGYGNMVVIENENGIETYYAHLSKILVKPNQTVMAGEEIGLGGRTGRATTDHLHLETRFAGKPFNPLNVFDFKSFALLRDSLVISNELFHDFDKDKLPPSKNKKKKSRKKAAVELQDKTQDSADSALVQKTSHKGKKKKKGESQASKKMHLVKSGDTLYSIAKNNEVSLASLLKANKLKKGAVIKTGQKLKIPLN